MGRLRKLVIFGNGLGRALNNNYFQLENALSFAWNNASALNESQKQLILQCLPSSVLEETESEFPKSEDELDRLQRVLAACDEIARHEILGGASWLNEYGKAFPAAIRAFVHEAASYFHACPDVLPAEFVGPLKEWALSSRPHIATLNYDELLYRAFVGTELMSGYSYLLDGFVPSFAAENLDRFHSSRQSYYLHLHGSPLYHNSTSGEIHKASLSMLPLLHGHSTNHVVLTHVDHKATVINASPVLREYWRRLEEGMEEAEGLILFGYGGADKHLNSLISKNFQTKTVEVVERNHEDYSTEAGKNARLEHWQRLISCQRVVAHWRDNILEFRNWGYTHDWS